MQFGKNLITAQVAGYLDISKGVFSKIELQSILKQQHISWNLPDSYNSEHFIHDLAEKSILRAITIETKKRQKIYRFVKKNVTAYEIALSLKTDTYLSHGTAAYLHTLTRHEPALIYTTYEQSFKQNRGSDLSQENLDYAFSQPQRRSENEAYYKKDTILLLNGMYTNKQNVVTAEKQNKTYPLSSIERTLIDVTVRPAYGGGAAAILDMFKTALKKNIYFEQILNMLQIFSFIYPYHQSIGFYLERAGYSGGILNEFKKMPIDFDFYLDYEIKKKKYSPEWKIYYPSEIG